MNELLAARDVAHLRADNPGPFTLSGTNSWVVGRDPAWVVDPGPALDAHLDALAAEVAGRGGAAGIALTHDHEDHVEGVGALLERLGGDVPVAAARWPHATTGLRDGERVGPLEAYHVPGHAPDHFVFLLGDVLFSGDAVLGEGSVFIAPDPGALRGYLEALEGLRSRELALICPGHGPVVEDPRAKIDQYVAHRLDRERRLREALERGLRAEDDLLDHAWSEVPAHLRPAATWSLRAHMDKLREEGRLPE